MESDVHLGVLPPPMGRHPSFRQYGARMLKDVPAARPWQPSETRGWGSCKYEYSHIHLDMIDFRYPASCNHIFVIVIIMECTFYKYISID